MQKNDMNLLERYNEIHKERSNEFSAARIYLAILLVVFLVLGAFTIQFWISETGLKGDVAALKEYNESPSVKAKMAEVATLKENIKFLDQLLTETKSINTVFDSAIRFDTPTLTVLFASLPKTAGVDSVSYSAGAVSIDIHATRPSDFSNYALRLKNEYYFKSVTYSTYTYDSTSKLYYATIRCVMKGGN
jgi:Tfp pilus assembly protein PilN